MVSTERTYTEDKKQLLYLFHTEPKEIKVRKRFILSDGTQIFPEFTRSGHVVNYTQDPKHEFAGIGHVEDYRLGRAPRPLLSYYLDLRNLSEKMLSLIGKVLVCTFPSEIKADVCAGIPKTGVKLAEKFAEFRKIPCLEIFQKVDGLLQPAVNARPQRGRNQLLLIDDILNKGTSGEPAIQIALNLGYQIGGILFVVDRQEGGTERLAKYGPVFSVFTAQELLSHRI